MDSFGSVGTVLFWIPVCVLLLAVLGSVWAPAAALTCVLAARFRKLTGESYAWVGAMCSMLLILPWVYLLVRLIFGRSLPVFVVAPVYLIIYAIWLIFYIAVFNVIALVVIIADIFVLHTEPLQISASLFVVLSVMLPMNVLYVDEVRKEPPSQIHSEQGKTFRVGDCRPRLRLSGAIHLVDRVVNGCLADDNSRRAC